MRVSAEGVTSVTELKVLGNLPSPHKHFYGLLFLVGLSASETHSCDLKLCPSKNVNASGKNYHI